MNKIKFLFRKLCLRLVTIPFPFANSVRVSLTKMGGGKTEKQTCVYRRGCYI